MAVWLQELVWLQEPAAREAIADPCPHSTPAGPAGSRAFLARPAGLGLQCRPNYEAYCLSIRSGKLPADRIYCVTHILSHSCPLQTRIPKRREGLAVGNTLAKRNFLARDRGGKS